MKTNGKKRLRKLANDFIGQRGIAWGSSGKDRGTHIMLHDGDGAAGGWSAVTLSNAETIGFANKFVRSLTNAEHLPAIRDLIDDETRGLRAEITRLRCQLMEERMARRPVSPYSHDTALIVAPCTALALVPAKGGAS